MMKAGVLEVQQGKRLVPDPTRGILRVLTSPLRVEWRPRDSENEQKTPPRVYMASSSSPPLRFEQIPGQRAVCLRRAGGERLAFFWIQEPNSSDASSADAARIVALNDALSSPSPPQQPPQQQQRQNIVDPNFLRTLMAQLAGTAAAAAEEEEEADVDLADVLRPSDVCTIVRSEAFPAAALAALSAQLPSADDGGAADAVCDTMRCPQLRQALGVFEAAVRSGDAAALCAEFGLPPTCQGPNGGMRRFLTGLVDLAKRKGAAAAERK